MSTPGTSGLSSPGLGNSMGCTLPACTKLATSTVFEDDNLTAVSGQLEFLSKNIRHGEQGSDRMALRSVCPRTKSDAKRAHDQNRSYLVFSTHLVFSSRTVLLTAKHDHRVHAHGTAG